MNREQMREQWRFELESDFHSLSGQPAVYAPGSPHQYGTEQIRVPLFRNSDKWSSMSINMDGTLCALAYKAQIDIYKFSHAGSRQGYRILRGHTADVDAVRFSPSDRSVLVTCAQGYRGGNGGGEPEIIIWDLEEVEQRKELRDEDLDKAAEMAIGWAGEYLASHPAGFKLSSTESEELSSKISALLHISYTKHLIDPACRIAGRLNTSFQSPIFDPSGKHLMVLPGKRPNSNTEDDKIPPQHLVNIYSLAARKTIFTLQGHTDAIMWSGYSPDENRIATISWDKTIRIWSSATGEEQHVFRTKGQNWAGAFSPDSKRFLGTCGDGWVKIWELEGGQEVWSRNFGGWCRAVDWSKDGKYIAVGGESQGTLTLLDVEQQVEDTIGPASIPAHIGTHGVEAKESGVTPHDRAATNHPFGKRILSVKSIEEGQRTLSLRFLTTQTARFLPASSGMTALVYTTSYDPGVEVYDLATTRKWRFQPEEDKQSGRLADWAYVEDTKQMVIVDGEAIRFWLL
jgi:WD40 repeat protein